MANTLYITGSPGAYHFEVRHDEGGKLRRCGSGRDLDEIERICRSRFGDELKVVAPKPEKAEPVEEVVAAPEPKKKAKA